MRWSIFMARSLCDWAAEQLGKGASFGGGVFVYNKRWPKEVPVFHGRTFIFADGNHEIRLKIDDFNVSREVFLRMRDLYHLPMPISERPENSFTLDVRPHAGLLDSIEYSHGSLLMRAKLKQEIYKDFKQYNHQIFEVLNNVSLRSILGAMHNLGPAT